MSSLIELQAIDRHYTVGHARLCALKNITLRIQPGEMLAITGASGSGKTSLMNILGLLDTPSKGDYYLGGQNVSQLSSNARAKLRNEQIGFVFQFFFLLPRLTVLQNVCQPLFYRGISEKMAKPLAMHWLSQLGMETHAHHRPNMLSGGQQQRTAIARALIGNPKIILADEPTGSLDSQTGQSILDIFKALNQTENKTIIIVTHDAHVAAQCPRHIILHDGELEEAHT